MEALTVAVMALVTYLTRIGGVVGMSVVASTARIRAFVTHTGSSVIIAILVVGLINGTPRTALAVAVAGGVMAATGRALVAMIAGVSAAAVAARLTLF